MYVQYLEICEKKARPTHLLYMFLFNYYYYHLHAFFLLLLVLFNLCYISRKYIIQPKYYDWAGYMSSAVM